MSDIVLYEARGRIGLIQPVSQSFCGACDRLRLTAEGQVRNCLFSTAEWDARAILRGNGTDNDLANLIRNCIEVVSASTAKALLLHRSGDKAAQAHAIDRGIGVVPTLSEALGVLERLHDLLPGRRGRLLRLADWFMPEAKGESLPHNPRIIRPLPPVR